MRLNRLHVSAVALAALTALAIGCNKGSQSAISADDLRAAGGDAPAIVSAADLPIELTYPQSDDQGNYIAPAEHGEMVIAGVVSSADPIDEIVVNGASVQPYRVENIIPYGAEAKDPVYRFRAPVVIGPEDDIVVEVRQSTRQMAGKFAPNRKRVVERLVTLQKASPRDPWTNIRLGNAYYATSAFDDAIDHFDQATDSGDDLPWAAYHLGMTYLALDRTEDALSSFSTASRLYPAWADPYYSRGLAYYGAGRHGDAILDLVEAADIAPSWAEPLLALGLTYYAQKELGEAANRFQGAIDLWPAWAPPYYGVGLVYLDQDRPDDAIRFIDRGLSLGPWGRGHHVQLAEKLAAKGNYNAANRQLTVAEKLGEIVPVGIYDRVRPHVTETYVIGDWPWAPRLSHGMRVVQGRGLDDIAEAVLTDERGRGDDERGGPRDDAGRGGPGDRSKAAEPQGKSAGNQGKSSAGASQGRGADGPGNQGKSSAGASQGRGADGPGDQGKSNAGASQGRGADGPGNQGKSSPGPSQGRGADGPADQGKSSAGASQGRGADGPGNQGKPNAGASQGRGADGPGNQRKSSAAGPSVGPSKSGAEAGSAKGKSR